MASHLRPGDALSAETHMIADERRGKPLSPTQARVLLRCVAPAFAKWRKNRPSSEARWDGCEWVKEIVGATRRDVRAAATAVTPEFFHGINNDVDAMLKHVYRRR